MALSFVSIWASVIGGKAVLGGNHNRVSQPLMVTRNATQVATPTYINMQQTAYPQQLCAFPQQPGAYPSGALTQHQHPGAYPPGALTQHQQPGAYPPGALTQHQEPGAYPPGALTQHHEPGPVDGRENIKE